MTVKLTPYLNMEGNARDAIQFYEQAMGAEVLTIITYGDMPEMPNTFTDDLKNLVAHAKIRVGETELMFYQNNFLKPYGKTVKLICRLKKPLLAQVLVMLLINSA